MSWSPFVRMFIARISYGRTIRQFIAGTLFAPVGASIVWFTVLGGSELFYQQNSRVDIEGAAPERALYLLLEALPIGTVLAVAASIRTILVVTLFFATSSDSGSLVVDMLTKGGDPHPNKLQRFFRAVTEGAVAAVLLVGRGPPERAVATIGGRRPNTRLPFGRDEETTEHATEEAPQPLPWGHGHRQRDAPDVRPDDGRRPGASDAGTWAL